ncbi:NIPSNAP family protein [Paenibacillus sp. sgz302251]|uniref:NIPSNAP family protein n=1 Tax=Paenibacillus sp. sgz302251 TaxID=3414493 RepID=UPI003C7AD81D
MLYELRIYTMFPEKLDAIHERFSNHTLGIFERLEMKVTDFWVDTTDAPKLYYILEYADMDERTDKWDIFRNDPEWIEVKRKSEENGPIVQNIEEVFMKRAEFFKAGRQLPL